MVSRNQFRVRASEYLNEDDDFLSLFGLEALDIFDVDNMWTKIQIIRSARGGGKTSILRIFTPNSLNRIHDSRTDDQIKPLYKKLQELDVYSEDGDVKVIGTLLSLFGNYTVLEQLDFNDTKQIGLFYALLSSRIILATLRSVAELKKLEFPKQLTNIDIKNPVESNLPISIPTPCNGYNLYEWASNIEKRISDILEEVSEDKYTSSDFNSLSILHLIKPENILLDGKQVSEKSLLMLDDVDKLTSKQRIHLSDTLVNLRIPISIWLSERLEALKREELLSEIGTWGREYDSPIILENFWRDHQKKFVTLLSDIADKRAGWERKYNITSFERQLEDFLDSKYDSKFETAIDYESNRLINEFGSKRKYRFLFDDCENSEENLINTAEKWRILEILIERDLIKKQKKIFDDDVTSDEFKITTKEKEVAEYYIRKKYDIPYYYGFSKVVKLASSNVQQFLDISSYLFDEMISARSFEKTPKISASRQEKIIAKAAEKKWAEINSSLPYSKLIIPFLNSTAKFCFNETNMKTASYGTVSGIAISKQSLKILQNVNALKSNSRYDKLANILSTCFAYNLLETKPESKQGEKGTTHLVMYLNRLLCFWYGLPLNYGGWREHSLETLCDFYDEKYQSKRKTTLDFSEQRILEYEDNYEL